MPSAIRAIYSERFDILGVSRKMTRVILRLQAVMTSWQHPMAVVDRENRINRTATRRPEATQSKSHSYPVCAISLHCGLIKQQATSSFASVIPCSLHCTQQGK